MKLFATLAALCATAAAAQAQTTTIAAKGGDIVITPQFHASFEIAYGGKTIAVDPFSPVDYSQSKKADLVLITDIHGDHMDENALAQVRSDKTKIVAPAAVIEKLKTKDNVVQLDNGQKKTVAGFTVTAVPMYNLQRGPKPGEFFHTKGRGNGYVLTIGGKRLYIAGDTEAIPEMKSLKKIDAAFLPMNLPYTMTPQEAAEGAKAFKPKIAIPYHYRYPFDAANDSPQQFAAALKDTKIEVRQLDWYPAATIARTKK